MNWIIKNATTGELWSDSWGWVDTSPAVFSDDDRAALNLPVGGEWIAQDVLDENHFDSGDVQIAALKDEVRALRAALAAATEAAR